MTAETPAGEIGIKGAEVIRRLVQRLARGKPLGTDVVLVSDDLVLSTLDASVDLEGEAWGLHRVRGELEMRDLLPDGDGARAAFVVPAGFDVPADVRDRAFLHRSLVVRVEDILSTLTGRPCPPLGDEVLEKAVSSLVPALAARVRSFTLSPSLQPRDVRSMVVAVLLESEGRIERQEPGSLLARWVVSPPLRPDVVPLLGQVLEEAFGLTGALLSSALGAGRLQELLCTGALAGGEGGRKAVLEDEIEGTRDLLAPLTGYGSLALLDALRQLSLSAGRTLFASDREEAKRLLAPAEAVAHRRQLWGRDYPLLRAAFDLGIAHAVREASEGRPLDDADVAVLEQNLHAASEPDAMAYARWLGRLARFNGAELPVPDALAGWADLGLAHIGWADRVAREVRRRIARVDVSLRPAGEELLGRYLARRDDLNRSFAAMVASRWESESHEKDLRRPFSLYRLAGLGLGPMLKRGEKVFLAVLDGCDLSVFLELCETLPTEIGLALPPEKGDALSRGLLEGRAFRPLYSLPPTVTSRARRAIFAGEIPGNPVLDDAEALAADATGDRKALEKCSPVAAFSRRLFLKGDLADGGAALRKELEKPKHDLVAAVFNGIDDALSSKETTPMPALNAADVGEGFLDALRKAVETGWTVVVTSDHGHTPFWSADRKLAGQAEGQRFRKGDISGEGALVLSKEAVPGGPYECLWRVGAFYGPQRRGFHGGVGLEEMIVPLGFFGRVTAGLGRPLPPEWWSSRQGVPAVDPALVRREAIVVSTSRPAEELPDVLRRLFETDAKALNALKALAKHGRLSQTQLARASGTPAPRLRGFMNKVLLTIRRAGHAEPFVIEGEATAETNLWTHTGRDAG